MAGSNPAQSGIYGPYFHSGAVKTLDEAVRVMANTQLNKELGEDQVENIAAFLEALTGNWSKVLRATS